MVGSGAGLVPPKQLYTILQQTSADKDAQQTSVFASDHVYVLPGGGREHRMPFQRVPQVCCPSQWGRVEVVLEESSVGPRRELGHRPRMMRQMNWVKSLVLTNLIYVLSIQCELSIC
jgi:hypothetical protein